MVNIRQGELETRPDGGAAILLRSFHHIFNPSRLARPPPSAKSTLIPDLLSPNPNHELVLQKYCHGAHECLHYRTRSYASLSAPNLIHISTLSDPSALDARLLSPSPGCDESPPLSTARAVDCVLFWRGSLEARDVAVDVTKRGFALGWPLVRSPARPGCLLGAFSHQIGFPSILFLCFYTWPIQVEGMRLVALSQTVPTNPPRLTSM